MSLQASDYAASTYSESTMYSKDNTTQQPRQTKRSFRQRVKDVVKDIGTSPCVYDDEEEKRGFAWVASVPPSRT